MTVQFLAFEVVVPNESLLSFILKTKHFQNRIMIYFDSYYEKF